MFLRMYCLSLKKYIDCNSVDLVVATMYKMMLYYSSAIIVVKLTYFTYHSGNTSCNVTVFLVVITVVVIQLRVRSIYELFR